MRLLRVLGLLLFSLSAILFIGYKGYETKIRDTSGPAITFQNDSLTVSVQASEQELLKDVTALDEKDGDVSASLLVEKISRFTGPGKRIITYAAFDSKNHISKAERELIYSDYTPPRFILSKPLIFNVGEENILQNMSVVDSIDGDLTSKIKYEAPDLDDNRTEGAYQIVFQVTNSAGDTAYLPTEVEFQYKNVQDQNKIPELELSNYIIYAKSGELINSWTFLKGVKIGQKYYSFVEDQTNSDDITTIPKSKVSVKSNVNRLVSGIYTITYSMTTDDGYTGTTKLLVVLEE